jgi:hypothetical protein
MKELSLRGLRFSFEVREDNQGCIAMAANPVNHRRTKHINISYHFTREALEDGEFTLVWVPSANMVADLLTKPVSRSVFNALVGYLMGDLDVRDLK